MPKSFFIDYSVTNNREARAEEAVIALRLSGHDLKKGSLLDIGCGSGSTTRWFSNNLQVYSIGVEVTERIIRENEKQKQLLEYSFASGTKLPFKRKSFHTVFLNDVLEHVSYQDAKEMFKEIQNVLDDNGMLYVSVASKFEIREPHSNLLFMSWFPRWVYAPIVRKIFHDDVYPYTVSRFKTLAENAKFTYEDFTWIYVSKKIKNINYIGNTMVRPLVLMLGKLGLTNNAGFLKFLEPFGVLLFVCKKHS